MIARVLLGMLAVVALLSPAGATFNYPGKGSARTVYYASSFVEKAVSVFQRAYGRWPASWAEVVETGMIQVPLYDPNGSEINPDDANLDFPHDVYYDSNATGPILIKFKIAASQVQTIEVQAQPTYRQTLMAFAPKVGREWQPYTTAESIKLIMVAAMLQQARLAFQLANDRDPTWQELLDSGLATVNTSSINPVTGLPFKFDGSPNDILVRYLERSPKHDYLEIEPVDSSGKPFKILRPY